MANEFGPVDLEGLQLEEAPGLKDTPPLGAPSAVDVSDLEDSTPDRLRSLYRQMRTSPDTEGRVIDFSKRSGIPQATVRNRLAEAERAAAEPDWDALQQSNPDLARQLTEDYDLFRVAHDDTESLTRINEAIRTGFTPVPPRGVIGDAFADQEFLGRTPAFLASGVPRTGEGIYNFGAGALDLYSQLLEGIGIQPWRGLYIGEEYLRQQAETLGGVRAGLQGDLDRFSTTQRAIATGLQSIPQSLMSLGAIGLGASASASLITFLGAPTSGDAYMEAQRRGLGPWESLAYATEQGSAEVLTEMVPALKFLGDIKVGAPFFRILWHQAVNETWAEQINTVMQDFSSWAHLNPEMTLNDFLAERPEAAWSTLVATLTSVGITTGGAAAIARTGDLYGSEREQAAQADAWRNRVREIQQVASESKLAERSPEKFKEVIGTMLKQSGTDTVYVNANEFDQYFQAAGVDPVQVATTLGVQDQLPGAIVGNRDIAIPASDLIAHMRTSELAQGMIDIVKPQPEAMSAKEADEWMANEGERFQELADRISRENAQDEEWQQSVDRVQTYVRDQIVATGRFGPDVAERQAALHGAFAQVVASRLGIKPHEVYEMYGLRVGGAPIVSDFDQEQVALQKFLEGSAVQEPVYHGTLGQFTEFDKAKIGSTFDYDFIQTKPLGFYFTNDPSEAELTANIAAENDPDAELGDPNVMRVYLSMRNPLQLKTNERFATTYLDENAEQIQDYVKAGGYDGVIVENQSGQKSYVVFEPTQIKSAIGNRGTYDPTDPNILHQGPKPPKHRRWKGGAKAGKYIGASEMYDSPATIRNLRKLLHRLAQEGEPFKDWYLESALEALKTVEGDPVMAERVVQLFAIFSPANRVGGNTTAAVKALHQWQRGEKITAGRFQSHAKTANRLMYEGKSWDGRKTNSFYINLMSELDPTVLDRLYLMQDGTKILLDPGEAPKVGWLPSPSPVTVDMWVMRLFGYGKDTPTTQQYHFAELELQHLAGQLGWTPHQAQAAVWVAMNGRWQQANGNYKPTDREDNLRARQAALDVQLDPDALVKGGVSFATYLQRASHNLTWEAVPSTKLEDGRKIDALPFEAKRAFMFESLKLVHDGTTDLIAEQVKLPFRWTRPGEGAYAGGVQPNAITGLVAEKNGDYKVDPVRLYARILQYIYRQDAVPFYRADPTAKGATPAVKLTFSQDLDDTQERDVLSALNDWVHPDLGFTRTEGNVLEVANYTDLSRQKFLQRMEDFANNYGDALGITDYGDFKIASEYGYEHDWSADPEGKALEDEIIAAGGQRLLPWIRDRRNRAESLARRYASGLGDAVSAQRGPSTFFQSAGTPVLGGGPAAANGLPIRKDGKVVLFHWSRQQGLETLDPEKFGTGIPGAESRRARNDPQNWVQRTYYGIGTGIEGGYRKEPGLGPNLYTVAIEPEKLYDFIHDPEDFMSAAREEADDTGGDLYNIGERMVQDAGYEGYFTKLPNLGVAAAVFTPQTPESEVVDGPFMVVSVYGQPVYHGSPHWFTEFDLSKIGTGEGAQAFGWGLYLAENPDVADQYRSSGLDKLLSEPVIVWDGSQSTQADGVAFLTMARRRGVTIAQIVDELRNLGAQGDHFEAVVADLSEGNFHLEDPTEGGGNLYDVDIPDEQIAKMLDWDTPVSEQPSVIQTVIRPMLEEAELEDVQSFTGEHAYEYLSRVLGGPEAVSKTLLAQGIPGIKYWDGGSRAAGNGTHNFVVFDPSILTITHVNGEPVAPPAMQQQNRGAIQFGADITADPTVIALFEGADLSTFLHESGHFFFEVYKDLASRPDADPQIIADMQALLDFVGVKDLLAWNHMSVEQRREGHEKVARAFEAYLFEGKAPSTGLQKLFRTFSQWLKHLYRNLTNLNVQLTDEVRGVFDRMLATEEEIKTIEVMKQYAPLFESIEQAGMTPQEWAEYQGLGREASEEAEDNLVHRSLRDMRWLTNAKSRELKRLQREAKAKREAVRKEAEEIIYGQPIYAAMRYLTHGDREPIIKNAAARKLATALSQEHHKLNKDALVEMYGKGPAAPWRYLPTGKYGVMASEGVHPNEVAELFGIESGDALVRGILEAPAPKDAIEELTDRVTMQRYGDLTNPAVLEQAADMAVHNEARLRFFATELKTLDNLANVRGEAGTDSRGRRRTFNVLDKAAREYADAAIGRKTVREAPRTADYAAAETRAGKAAAQAMRKGDVQQAAEHKRAQLLNAHFVRAANKASDEIDKAVRYLKKFENEGTRKALSQDYLDQIDQLLERFDLRKSVTPKQIEDRKALAKWVAEQQEKGFTPVIPKKLEEGLHRQHYTEMTLDDLRGLRDAVKSIDHLGRVKKKLLTAKDKREFDAIIEAAVESIDAHSKGRRVPQIETDLPQDWAKKSIGEFFAMHRKLADLLRRMDGFQDNGAMWNLLMRPLNSAMDLEAAMKEASTVFLTEQFSALHSRGKLYQKENVPGVGQLTKMARIMVALNLGNDINRARLSQGFGWDSQQIANITDSLSKEDWDFVQAIWDHINSYWGEIAAKEKRVNGIAPEKVEATPVVTPFGEYRGGYFPIKYNTDVSPKAFAQASAEAAKNAMRGSFARATTRRGHLEQRLDEVKRPLRLDFSVIFEHLEQVVHDIALHEFLIDQARVLNDARMQAAIIDNYGNQYYRQINAAMTAVAAGDVPAVNAHERAANWLRTGASIAGMGWKITTAMLQPLGLTQSMQRIGTKWVGRGIAKWLTSSRDMEGTVAWVHSKSTMMRLRGKTLQREINEIRNRIAKESWFQDQLNLVAQAVGAKQAPDVASSFFYLIMKLQMVADVPTWLGQYEKSMAEGVSEEDAIALADQAVLDAQGGGQIKDLAGIQRGNPWFKLWTNFYSYFNVTYNRTAESIQRTDWRSAGSVGQLAVDSMLLYVLPSVLASLMYEGFRGRCDGDWDCVGKRVAGDLVSYSLGTIVGLRELQSMFTPYGYQGPAGARVFESLTRFGKQVSQGEIDEAFLKAANQAAGALLHYPAGQVEYTMEGMYDLLIGETVNPAALAFGNPQ